MLTKSQSPEDQMDIHQFFHQHPSALFDLQKGYLPPTVLAFIIEREIGLEAYIHGWESYLANIALKPQWRLAGNVEVGDFIASMLSGYIPSKDTFQKHGGIWKAVENYDPGRNETRPTCCPACGSSFWSHEFGNSWKAFASLNIPEYRANKDECPPHVRVNIDGRDKKVCGHILSGPYESEQAAQMTCPSENQVANIDSQWFVVCGHPVSLMSLYNYVHAYIMKPLRAEHKRFLTAKTKGRMNVMEAYNCPTCGQLNEAQLEETTDENLEKDLSYECHVCYARHSADDLTFFTIERNNVSLDTPLGDDGKATIGDMLPSPAFVHEELAQVQLNVQSTLSEFTTILEKIVEKNVDEARRRFKDRQLSKIPQLERSLRRAKSKNDAAKVAKTQKKLDAERENLVKDQNKIDYSGNLVEMFKLHYIGDEEGNKYDLRTLTERFMFKSLPYTLCRTCQHRDYEQNEKGKLQTQQLNARLELQRQAALGEVKGYDRQEILNTNASDLFPELGSFFHCTECGGHDLEYFGHNMKNPAEPRVEITPHIFQPAQREIRDLESQIFSYKLICPNCSTANNVRPDRMTGKLLDHKISKRITENEEGQGRKAVRERVEHRCSRCNHELTLDDVITSSNAKDAYSLLLKLRELVAEREVLRRAARLGDAGDDGWSVQSA